MTHALLHRFFISIGLLGCLSFSPLKAQFQKAFGLKTRASEGLSLTVENFYNDQFYIAGKLDYIEDDPIRRPMLASIDMAGNFLWANSYNVLDGYFFDMAKSPSFRIFNDFNNTIDLIPAGFGLVGSTQQYDSKNRDGLFIRTDYLGRPEKYGTSMPYYSYGGQDNDNLSGVISLTPGFILVGGSYSYNEVGRSDMMLIKTDTWGAPIKQLILGNKHETFADNIIKTLDKKFLVIGTKRDAFEQGNDILITKIDEDLNVIWTKYIQTFDNPKLTHIFHEISYDIKEDPYTGDILILAKFTDPDPNEIHNTYSLLVKLDADGNGIWSKRLYDPLFYKYSHELKELAINYENGFPKYILGGNLWRSSDITKHDDALLVKIDHMGNIDFARSYTIDYLDWSINANSIAVHDGYYALAGEFTNRTYLLETDQNGDIGSNSECVSYRHTWQSEDIMSTIRAYELNSTIVDDFQRHDPIYESHKLSHTIGCEEEVSSKSSLDQMGQNYPNPFETSTTVEYQIEPEFKTAYISIVDEFGMERQKLPLKDANGKVLINAEGLDQGVYYYSLIVDGVSLETKRLILSN
jgi:hypothetical protein